MMGGFNTIIPKVTPAEVEIPLNKVKLPTPLESDYITPLNVQVSSYAILPMNLSAKELRVSGVVNKSNIYDGDDTTYAYSSGIVGKGQTLEKIVWDLGSIRECNIRYKHQTINLWSYSRLWYSNDDVNYTLIDEVTNDTKEGTVTVTCRYLKWEIGNMSSLYDVYGDAFRLYTLEVLEDSRLYLTDDDETSYWQPDPINEAGAYVIFDMGALKICGGCRIYWGAENRPSSYVIEVSEDGSTWETVYDSNGETPPAGWKEYSWNARYCRYIRYRNTHPTGENQQINEFDYYSRIVERVASEHGHGSGITPHLKGHGVRKGFTYRRKLSRLVERNPQLKDLIDYLEFMLNE